MTYYDSPGSVRDSTGAFTFNGNYGSLNGTSHEQGLAGVNINDTELTAMEKLDKYRLQQTMGSGSSSSGSSDGAAGLLAIPLLFALPFILMALVVAILPFSLVWHYRKKNWRYFALTVLTVLGCTAYLFPATGGNLKGTGLGVTLFGAAIYLPIACFGWANHALSRKFARGLSLRYSFWLCLVLLGAAVPVEYFFLLAVVKNFLVNPDRVSAAYQFINHTVGLQVPLHLQSYSFAPINAVDNIALAIAALPTSTVLTLLCVWFKRRVAQGKRAVPWLFGVPAMLGIGGLLFVVVLVIVTSNAMDHANAAAAARAQSAQSAAPPATRKIIHIPYPERHARNNASLK